jgi:hypothetical protein
MDRGAAGKGRNAELGRFAGPDPVVASSNL